MFEWNRVEQLNELEMGVYSYVIAHIEQVGRMKIRELAEATNVSTSTILRFCSKMGCEGYSEFRYQLKNMPERDSKEQFQNYAKQSIDFLQNAMSDPELEKRMLQAANMIRSAQNVIFYGLGSSGALCQYGARFFSNVGVYSTFMNDPFYPRPGNYYENSLLFVLSVSGETKQVVEQICEYKKKNAAIVSITNSDNSTVARLSDLHFSTYMPALRFHSETNDVDLTPQIPTLYLLETLGRYLIGDNPQNL